MKYNSYRYSALQEPLQQRNEEHVCVPFHYKDSSDRLSNETVMEILQVIRIA